MIPPVGRNPVPSQGGDTGLQPFVWLLWEKARLLGVFASEDLCEYEADARRSQLAEALGRHGVAVRTEKHAVMRYPFAAKEEQHSLRVEVATLVERWPLLDEAEALLPVQDAVWDRYLMVPFHGRLWLPAFQFEGRGRPWVGLRQVLLLLRAAGWSDSRIFVWFTTDQASMGGRPPAEYLGDAPQRVIAAAEWDVRS